MLRLRSFFVLLSFALIGVANAQLSKIEVDPVAKIGGGKATGKVILKKIAPTGGTPVNLSANSADVTMPGSVIVPAGKNYVSFGIGTVPVATDTPVTLTATSGGITKTTPFTVRAPYAAWLSLYPKMVTGGTKVKITVAITGVAPAGGSSVALKSSQTFVKVPATAVVPEGATSIDVSATTSAVAADGTATISATLNGTTVAGDVAVLAPVPVTLKLEPAEVACTLPSMGTVMLSGPAPKSGLILSLSSSGVVAAVPASLTFASGAKQASFTISTVGVAANTDAEISAGPLKQVLTVLTTGLDLRSSWPKYRGGFRNDGIGGGQGATGVKAWSIFVSDPREAALAADGTIYLATGEDLVALDSSGQKKWTRTASGGCGDPTVGADGTIYAGINRRLYAIRSDGSTKWTFAADVSAAPAIAPDGTVYVGSSDQFSKTFYAVTPEGKKKWSRVLDSSFRSTAAIGQDGTVFIPSAEGVVYALSPTDGNVKWKYDTGNYITPSPAIGANGIVYIGSHNGLLYAFDPSTGKPKWTFDVGGAVDTSAAIAPDGTIYIGAYLLSLTSNALIAVTPQGKFKWAFSVTNPASTPIIAKDGTVYFGSADWKIYALKPTGGFKWSYKTNSGIYGSPAIGADGRLYVGSSDSRFYCFR